ncbi:S-layer homology domain-containing protein [Aureibacillus halotolerans]|uniref:S-layer family protein n=1 Tax=Aureibacillus halotolerans TaxID=1508390 RepID=A0A4R6TVS2_9BACI|nr:S-layer homology domain-containing protein [Aureibacillus halotolerans]TDQ36089.1 S-layer family protein [Aureibacillus halotolerans]
MKRVLSIFLALVLLLAPFVSANASVYQTPEVIGRGEFFEKLVDRLELEPLDGDFDWPVDVNEDSRYADAIKTLIQRGALKGYPGDKIQPERPLFDIEAAEILSRLLHVDKDTAIVDLDQLYNLSMEDGTFVTENEATEIFENALVTDESGLEWINASTDAAAEVTSFEADANMTFSVELSDEMLAELGEEFASMLSIDASLAMAYDEESGIHQVITFDVPEMDPSLPETISIEQYVVKDGIYMNMPNLETGEDEWVKIPADDAYPIAYEEMLKTQSGSIELYKQLNGELFFYEDLGSVNDTREIAFRGLVPSINELLSLLQSNAAMDEQMDVVFEDLGSFDASVGISGTIWVDENSKHVSRQLADATVTFDDQSLGIEAINIWMDMAIQNYNSTETIVLPEAAKNAEEISLDYTLE